jgi:hypothetical protein
MRWNPVIRYLVFRDLPESEFCGFDETGTRPVLKKDTVAFRDYRRNVQAQLREVFTTLDQGRGVSTAQMAAFRRVMGSIGGDTSKWATTQQQDAQEFQNHLEDLLLKSTIEVPGTKDCLVSGLQEAVRTEIRILPDEGILKPAAAGAGKDRYIVSGSVGYRNMYPLSLEVTRASQTSAPQVARSFNSGRVRSTLERPDEVEDVPYLMQTTYTHEDALALRARVQESEKVTRVDYDRARTGAFVELERRGNPYRVGRCQKVQEVVRNPPSIGVIAVRQAINTRDLTRPWRVGGVVPFPESFERKDLESSSPEAKVTYDLVSCVCHSGGSTLSSGHYIAYAKINGSWYCFNDGSVTKASDFNPLTNPNIYTVQYMKRVESAAGIIA